MSKTVLVIEDDPHINLLISENLRNESYRVVSSHNGEDGVAAAQAHLPDLITLDLLLPRLNGWEVCQRLRASDAPTRHIPIVIVSVLSKDAKLPQQTVGPLTLISKPFDVKELMSVVRRLIGEPAV